MWLLTILTISAGRSCDSTSLQSPIDIVSPFSYLDPGIRFYLGAQEQTFLYHDGYSLRIDGDFGGFLSASSYFWSTGLVFKQPSEHTLQGSSLPMELQVFFRDQLGNEAVLVAFFTESSESNFLDEVGFGNPQLRDAEDGAIFSIKEPVDVAALLGYPETFLYYEGSTTVAPCVANVTWILLTDTYKASKEQLGNFPRGLKGGVRKTQPANGRKIYSNFGRTGSDVAEIEGEVDEETLIQEISRGKTYKEGVNDQFIVEKDTYLADFPSVKSIFSE
jgi:carbonic anhydrase